MDDIVIAWYKKDEYDKLLRVIDDKDSMPSVYEVWLEIATATMQNLRKEGYNVKKVIVNIDELVDWCNVMKKENIAKNRALFVSLRANKNY
ncbi:MAG: hypothetical protein EVJ48_01550 [Candidatus Acidulodesulfobacterium acidiphilum]|jgi:hypothetical protein|uniref:Uncharacterized protein n=2 Tax=Candidatus Acidulodesulfobacterales TaxID=2597219 RepID=A0A519BE64_ACIG2|nr:MAG: hypothetical protein EVJ46_09910 [Candidatus Acididesulfobacter guangdongensis]RZV40203.1 MAG: hypothetical protein EVJ48_01550 [Candidatus Acidulodesulfobacterium acidiphilum]